jgi:hypothetical protein
MLMNVLDAKGQRLASHFDDWPLPPPQMSVVGGEQLSVDERIDVIYAQLAARRQELHLDVAADSTITLLYMIYKCVRVRAHILRRARTHTQNITSNLRAKDETTIKRNDWEFASHVVDRACLGLLTIFIAASTMFIFFSAPYLTVELDAT